MYLAQNIRYLREQKGISQHELAGVLAVSVSAVGMYEQERRELNIRQIIKLSEHFGVTLDDLVLKDLKPPIPRYAENMSFLRKKRDMSQEDIGHLLGVTQKCVSKYENGERAVDVEKLLKFSDFFGVTLDQLVKHDLSKEG